MCGRLRSALGVAALVGLLVVATTAAGPVRTASAEPGSACRANDTGRFADCRSGFYSWNIRQANGDMVGTADVAFTISETVSPTSRAWSAHWTVYVVNLSGAAEAGTTMAVVPECGGSCSAGTGLPDGGAVLSRNQTVAGDIAFSAPGQGEDTSTQTVNIYLFNPAALGPGTTYGDPRTTLGPVRCDDGVPGEVDAAGSPTPGCVLSGNVPTFVINFPVFKADAAPVHAAFVAAAQNDPRTTGFGRPGAGRPLVREYLATREAKDAKRDQSVCRRGFQRYPSAPGTPDRELDTCDEYPYLSTRQGVPRFSVTGHVPQRDNNGAGSQLSQFYSRYHVGDGDEFYVQP